MKNSERIEIVNALLFNGLNHDDIYMTGFYNYPPKPDIEKVGELGLEIFKPNSPFESHHFELQVSLTSFYKDGQYPMRRTGVTIRRRQNKHIETRYINSYIGFECPRDMIFEIKDGCSFETLRTEIIDYITMFDIL